MHELSVGQVPRRCPACGTAAHLEFDEKLLTTGLGGGIRLAAEIRRVSAFVATCPSCHEVLVYLEEGRYVATEHGNRPETDQVRWVRPPAPARPLPTEIDQTFRDDFAEAERVLPISPNASAALARRLLQRIIRETTGITRNTLYQEIGVFIEEKSPPADLARTLDEIREFGNTGAHPERDSAGVVFDVEPAEAAYTLDAVEQVLDWLVVQPARREEQRATFDRRREEAGVKPIRRRTDG